MAKSAASVDPAIAGLDPAPLWSFFYDLTRIPRPSKHEERVLQYLKDFADARSLKWRQDATGNVVISRPGSGGGEAAPPVVIQGHVDMVCEKNNDTVHDFFKDPLTLERSDPDWLKAKGTTLGADNGIGVATALALLDLPATVKLPPLECLFTVDEETGLTGAFNISGDMLQGRTMLNLDTEDWGEIFMGCAGGGDTRITLDVTHEPLPADHTLQQVKVGGLLGGHSGLNIHEDRGNAVQLAARVASALLSGVTGARLAAMTGGDKRNAIAREAGVVVAVPPGAEPAVAEVVSKLSQQLTQEYGTLEKDMFVRLEPATPPATTVISEADTRRLLALVSTLPHGALKYSHAVKGLVETSNNVASVQGAEVPGEVTRRQYEVVTSTRSSLAHALEAVRDRIESIANLVGARVAKGKAYPGWAPNPDSPVLQVTRAAYRELLGGGEPHVGAIHAGLECGILGERFPGMDMVSFGPTIKGAHSPDEKVQISTVAPFWKLTLRVLEVLADKRA